MPRVAVILLKAYGKAPFEINRKLYHLVITLSIFPLEEVFSTWYMAVLAAFLLVLIAYPALALLEHSSLYKRVAVERGGGEFKRSLIIVQVSIALLIFVFWGLHGEAWKYIAFVPILLVWGRDLSLRLVRQLPRCGSGFPKCVWG